MTQEYEFTVGSHNEQAHDYTSVLIDEAYKRKAVDRPTTSNERVRKAEVLCEAYYVQIDDIPAEAVLSRLAWYIVFDEMTDDHPDKMTREEYPIMSDSQSDLRRFRERSISDVHTGKDDITIGRRKDHQDGSNRRIYDYMTPKKDNALIPTDHLDLYDSLDTAGLTERQRQAIDLVYFEGMTQEDAASVMGVSDRAVRYFLSGGIAKIRQKLEETTS